LPPALTLSTDGLLDGIPTESGTYTFTIQATDSNPGLPFSGQQEYILLINTRPEGGNGSATLMEDSIYNFAANDFPYSDVDGDNFGGIEIASPVTNGSLTCAGVDVVTGTICANVTLLVFKPESNENGEPYASFGFRVLDEHGTASSNSYDMVIHVSPVNDAPVLAAIGSQSGDEETLISFTASAVDIETPDELTFSLDPGAPDGTAIDPATGAFTWTPSEIQGPGTYSMTVRVSDNGIPVLEDFETFQISVGEVNLQPQLTPIGDQSGDEENLISFIAAALDPDLPANNLTFSLEDDIPEGAAIDSATGVFTWTPTEAQGPGVYTATIRVADDGIPILDDYETIQIAVGEVNLPPSAVGDAYETLEDNTLVVGAPGVLNNDNDPDIPVQTLYAELIIPPIDGELALMPNGSFVYTPTLNFNGVVTFTYAASDGLLSDVAEVFIAVTPVNDPPIVEVGDDQTVTEGQEVTFHGSYFDPGKVPQSKLETIFWDFGDGSTADGTLEPTHIYADNGVYTVTLLVADDQGGAGLDTLVMTVENAAPVLEAIENQAVKIGQTLNIQAMFSDPGMLDTHEFTIDWGDVVTETIELEAGQYSVDLDHIYTHEGSFNVTMTVIDDDGGSDEILFGVTVEKIVWKLWLPISLKMP
jgi:PKD repeat protein